MLAVVGYGLTATGAPAAAPHRRQIYATSYPLFYIAQRLGRGPGRGGVPRAAERGPGLLAARPRRSCANTSKPT